MMSGNIPKIYLKYAKEFDKIDPVIALCCRSHYVGKQIHAKQRSKESLTPEERKEINCLLNTIDAANRKLGLSREARKKKFEEFCDKAFTDIATEELSAPKLTTLHAVQFNAVGNFIEILKIFGRLDDLWEERRRFCKYKATSILKCLKKGKNPPRGKPSNCDKLLKELFENPEPEEEKHSIVKMMTMTEKERDKIREEEDRIKHEDMEEKRKFTESIKPEVKDKTSNVINAEVLPSPELHFPMTNNAGCVQNYPFLREPISSSSLIPLTPDINNIIIPITNISAHFNTGPLEPDDVIIPVEKRNFDITGSMWLPDKRKDTVNQLQEEPMDDVKVPVKSEIPDEDVTIPFFHIKRNIKNHEDTKISLNKPKEENNHCVNQTMKLIPAKGQLPKPEPMEVENLHKKDAEFEKIVLRIMNNVEYALDELKFINVKNGKQLAKNALLDFNNLHY